MIELFDAYNMPVFKPHAIAMTDMVNESDGQVVMWTQYCLDYSWIVIRLQELLGDLTGKKILDAGCGKGVLQFYLKKLGADVYSCDINDYTKQLQTYNKDVKFTCCNFSDERQFIPFNDNFFDAVVCVSVLEHMLPFHAQWSCQNFAKLIKKGGYVLITTDLYKYRMYTEKHIVFSKSDCTDVFCNDELKLLNDYDNFKDCEQLHFKMSDMFVQNRLIPLLCVPGGVVLTKP